MSGNSPIISIITPAYNHESYIQDTIYSVLDQDFPSIEFIIIDDGSTDNTSQKIEELGELCKNKLKCFKFIKQTNKGVVEALNEGLKNATGDFIYFLASDDIAHKTALSTLYEFLKDNPEYGLAVGNNDLIDSNGHRCYWDQNRECCYWHETATYLSFGDFLIQSRRDVNFHSQDFGTYQSLITGNYIPNGPMIRKNIMDEVGYFSKTAPLEDYFLMLQISKITKMKYLDKPLFSYRWHGTNTIKNEESVLKKLLKTIKLEKSYCERHKLMKRWCLAFTKCYFKLVVTNIKNFRLLNISDLPSLICGTFLYFQDSMTRRVRQL